MNLDRIFEADGPTPREDETDEEFCRRLFDGELFECKGCGKTIGWSGVCDDCYAKWLVLQTQKDKPKTHEESMARAGVPKAYCQWTWKGCLVPDDVRLARIREWRGDPPLLTIVGPAGSGKTGLSVCILRDWILEGRQVRWLYMPDWIDELRNAERDGDPYTAFRTVVERDGLLVLDDMVSNRTTDYQLERLLQIIDGRNRELRPTLATSNIIGRALEELEPRVASRITGGMVVRWTGADRRREHS